MNKRKLKTKRHEGFALVLVLLLIAAGTTLGLTYVSTSTIRLIGGENLLKAARAQYVAESGLQHALYLLHRNPGMLSGSSDNPLGPFYVDGSTDTYRFLVTADSTVMGKFYVTAEGTAAEVTRSCSYTVFVHQGSDVDIRHGMIIGGAGASLPSTLEVTGDLHNNGDFLHNMAIITGDVTSYGPVMDPFLLIEGSVTAGVPKITLPDIRPEYYRSYLKDNHFCEALTKTTRDIGADDEINNGGSITAANPGGVVELVPEYTVVKLKNDVEFQGTIIIDGDLLLEGKDIHIVAQEGFPAIVVTGRVIIAKDTTATIEGLVVAAGGIVTKDGFANNSITRIQGGLIAGWMGYESTLRGHHELIYDSQKTLLTNFGCNASSGFNIQILDYSE